MSNEPSFDFVIVGNNISALVGAAGLARSGHAVALVNPTRAWGGHFRGVSIDGQQFDYGMVIFEFTSFLGRGEADVLTYDPARRNDAGRFCSQIARFVHDVLPVREAGTPQMYRRGVVAGDVLLSNRFDMLRRLDLDLQMRLRTELGALLAAPNPLHAAGKLTDPERFAAVDYRRASLANHGPTFHALFIEPMVRKILFASSSQIPALFHRGAWLPLYHPETLHSQLTDSPQVLQPTRFYYPHAGHFSAFVDALQARAADAPGLARFDARVEAIERDGSYVVRLEGRTTLRAPQLVWGLDQDQLWRALNGGDAGTTMDRASLSFVFLPLETRRIHAAFSSLFLLDETIPAYRITNQTFAAGRADGISKLVVELNTDYAADQGLRTDEDLGESVRDLLLDLGIVESRRDVPELAVRRMPHILPVPSFENHRRFLNLQDRIQHTVPDIRRLGSASGFVSKLVNDHIVQALKLIKEAGSPDRSSAWGARRTEDHGH